MPLVLSIWLVRVLYAYVAIGVLLLPWWHWRGLRQLDTTAASGPWGFRILISFGLVALWPAMLRRAKHARGHPSIERTAHRDHVQPEASV